MRRLVTEGMLLPNPLCWLEAIFRTIWSAVWVQGATVSGHQLQEESRLNNCVVTVLKCARCGKYEVGWERTARSTREPYPDER